MVDCPQCARGYQKKDSTHAEGCPKRWVTFGEYFDNLSYEEKKRHFELLRDPESDETIQEYSDRLYRPKRKRKERAERMKINIHTSTIEDGKQYILKNIEKGTNCPCCNQKVKQKKRQLTERHASIMCLLYKTFPVGTVLDVGLFLEGVPTEMRKELTKGSEWNRLTWWGFLHNVDASKDMIKTYREVYPAMKGKKVTLQQLTQQGYDFIAGAPAFGTIYVYDDRCVNVDTDSTTSITQILSSEAIQVLWGLDVPQTAYYTQ